MAKQMQTHKMELNRIYQGNSIDTIKTFPDNSIDCCVTSPPYYALRDYGTGTWAGGDPNCTHENARKKTRFDYKIDEKQSTSKGTDVKSYEMVCPDCGAVRVDEQIGLEETPEAYINRLADLFDEIKRAMKPEGTLWLNIGDSYWGGGWRACEFNQHSGEIQKGSKGTYGGENIPGCKGNHNDIKPKDLVGIPWMLAFELRKRGWYLRQDIIWHKPNPMPESVTDRCTKSHEYVFLLTKSQRYYFDHEAIQEKANMDYIKRYDYAFTGSKAGEIGGGNFQDFKTPKTGTIPEKERTMTQGYASAGGHRDNSGGFGDYSHNGNAIENGGETIFVRNKRDVWSVNVKPNRLAHFATFPEALIAPMILAGCPKNGVVLDPFMGSGTTGLVAHKYGRNFVGCELNPEYVKMAEERLKTELSQLQLDL